MRNSCPIDLAKFRRFVKTLDIPSGFPDDADRARLPHVVRLSSLSRTALGPRFERVFVRCRSGATKLARLNFLIEPIYNDRWERTGYGQFIHHLRSPRSITSRLRGIRRAWVHTMLGRDNRITDAALIGHAVHSTMFFASTTMVALAALLGVLANFDHSFSALTELAFTAKTSRAFAQAKLLLLVLVFAHTFLKLTWTIRQLNYSVALLGAAPIKPSSAQRDKLADHIAAVLSLTVSSFNAGIRGYYFALAALAWLLGPGPFALATSGIIAMLLWRQFGSETAEAIRLSHAVLMGEAAGTEGRNDLVARSVAGASAAAR